MAFARNEASQETTSVNSFVRFKGLGTYHVIAVNPSKEELEKIQPWRKDLPAPEYLGVMEDNVTRFARIDVYVQLVKVEDPSLVKDHLKVDSTGNVTEGPIERLSYRVIDSVAYNRDKTKVQVIDLYGDTQWFELDADGKPVATEGQPIAVSRDGRRPAYKGEDKLIDLFKALGNVNSRGYVATNKETGVREYNAIVADTDKEKLALCVAQFDNIPKWFTGDFSDLKNLVKVYKGYGVKLLQGVKSVNGKQYTDFFLNYPLKVATRNYSFLSYKVTNAKQTGMYSQTDFGELPFTFQPVEQPTPTDLSTLPMTSEAPSTGLVAGWDTLSTEEASAEVSSLPF